MSGFDNSGYHIVQHQSGFLRKRTAAVFINQQLQRRAQPFCESTLRTAQKIAAELLVFLHDAQSFHKQRTGGFLIGAAPRDTPVREIAKQLLKQVVRQLVIQFVQINIVPVKSRAVDIRGAAQIPDRYLLKRFNFQKSDKTFLYQFLRAPSYGAHLPVSHSAHLPS